MAKIRELEIKNYRCIEYLSQKFHDTNLICLIGRGDSGKTSILHAIQSVLAPNWNFSFTDTDFYNCNINQSIEIKISLSDIPEELLTDSKYGLFKRGIKSNNEIVDDILTEDIDEIEDLLSIKLIVDKDLEPKWYVVNDRSQQDDVEIGSGDRSKLNVFLVSDFLDRHFSWSKGTPLYSLLKALDIENDTDKIITDANRKAVEIIKGASDFNSLETIISSLEESATSFGLSLNDIKALIDFKNTIVKEGNITIHSEGIPIRLNGKGTRRLLSIVIQLELAKKNGMILIDEIEQGLEPDRARFVAKQLCNNEHGQVLITTHSSNVLVELSAENIYLVNKNKNQLYIFNSDFQGAIRKNPEAFFSKKIIVCEGATEVGICRSLNDYRILNNQDNLAVLGIAVADGTGSNFVEYCTNFKDAGYEVCAFCDSDNSGINDKKKDIRSKGITIVDCEEGNSIEHQLFKDLPWDQIVSLINYAIELKSEQSILDITGKTSLGDLITNDTAEIRTLLGEKSSLKGKGWYKRIDHGEVLGKIWLESLSRLEGKRLKEQIDSLQNWISE